MIGIGNRIEVGFMTSEAHSRGVGISCGMTFLTGNGDVSASKGKTAGSVIEESRFPGAGVVTDCAIVIEIVRHMIGIGNRIEVGLMAGKTG
jgi:hypothetical protein